MANKIALEVSEYPIECSMALNLWPLCHAASEGKERGAGVWVWRGKGSYEPYPVGEVASRRASETLHQTQTGAVHGRTGPQGLQATPPLTGMGQYVMWLCNRLFVLVNFVLCCTVEDTITIHLFSYPF